MRSRSPSTAGSLRLATNQCQVRSTIYLTVPVPSPWPNGGPITPASDSRSLPLGRLDGVLGLEYCTRARFGTAWQWPTRSSSLDLTSVAICNAMRPSTCLRAQADWGTVPNGVNARGADYNPLLRKPEYPAASLRIRVQDGDVVVVPAHCATHELLRSASRRR
jgi:hypothetical protein